MSAPNRTILIPLAGTAAAVLGFFVAKWTEPARARDREAPPEVSKPEFREGIRNALEEEDLPEAPEPAPVPIIELKEDGSFEDFTTGEKYADAAALLLKVAPEGGERGRIVLRRATAKVTVEALDAAAQGLRARVEVHKDPEEPKK